MYIPVDETFQLGLDCFAALSPRHAVLLGWAMTPRGEETGVTISAGREGPCRIEHCSFHPRPDVSVKDPRKAVVNGFCLVLATPPGLGPLVLSLRAGDETLPVDLRDPAIERDLPKVTVEREWMTTFNLLVASASDPCLEPLLGYQGRPFGAFSDWISRLPALRGRVGDFAGLAEAEAITTAAGEVLLMMRSSRPLAADAEAQAVLTGRLRRGDGSPGEPMVLPMADSLMARHNGALAFYARAEASWIDRLASLELIVTARLRGEERIWMRAVPTAAPAADLLDAASRVSIGTAPLGKEGEAGLELLRRLAGRREAAFAPALAALAAAPDAVGAVGERIGVILGADDPVVARLFHVTAPDVEDRCDRLLVLGEASAEIGQVFARRGRLPVLTGPDAFQALREAAGRAQVLPIDATRYAEAIAEGRPDAAFHPPMPGAELARLLALHAVAAAGPSLSHSLARLLRPRSIAGGEARFTPLGRGWSSRAAGDLANAHLSRLWAARPPAAPRIAETVTHD